MVKKMEEWEIRPNGNLVTPVFTAAFAALLVPKGMSNDPNSEKKYSVSMIFPKGQDFKPLKDYIMRIATEKWGTKAAEVIKKQESSDKRVFKDGSDMAEKYAGFIEGAAYLNASNKERPGLVGRAGSADGSLIQITEEGDFYSGCQAIASIKPYCWDNKWGKGVSLSLQNVQKIGDGERLGGGRSKPQEDFEAADVDADMGGPGVDKNADPWG